jgi:ArsR family transcriptional regulator, arsenate/arsenite/antimonite-responsive transcriptional repressor
MTKPKAPDRAIRDVAEGFKLLADETRLKIIAELKQAGEMNVTDLCERIGITQPALSHHLALCRVSGLVEAQRDGKFNFYSLRPERFAELRDFLPVSAVGVVGRVG